MKTIYTTTITDEAKRRGIGVRVIDENTPIFELRHSGRAVRCFNALTDRVGAVSFHLAQNKHLANRFLARAGYPVPEQMVYASFGEATGFLRRHGRVVVKPAAQWGGRGGTVGVESSEDLRRAIRAARRFDETVLIEQFVRGSDYRVIVVNGRFVAAIRRNPATVCGNGRDSIWTLIRRQNHREAREDPSHRIPLDAETRRNLRQLGWSPNAVPRPGERVTVRLTSNYHTGGTVDVVTRETPKPLVRTAKRVAKLLGIPVLGVDFLVDATSGRHWIVELSPDLAISPPEGAEVARHFLDFLFPETRHVHGRRGMGGKKARQAIRRGRRVRGVR